MGLRKKQAGTMSDRFDAPLQKTPTLAEAVRRAFGKAFVFSGRAARAEFWKFVLFSLLVNLALVVIWSLIFGANVTTLQVTAPDGSAGGTFTQVSYSSGWLGTIFNLVCLIPSLSLAWRRLHDRDHGGWWILVPTLVPLIAMQLLMISVFGISGYWSVLTGGGALQYVGQGGGLVPLFILAVFAPAIYVFVQLVSAGTPGVNRFGPPPYEVRP